MDTYLTTYRKDYLWPYVNTTQVRGPTHAVLRLPDPVGRDGFGPPPQHPMVGSQYLTVAPLNPPMGPLACGCCGCNFFTTQRPTPPLLDPIIYPAKVGASPESEISRYDQPNTYLRKLHEKYPYLYKILRCTPPDDIVQRVFRDRMLTTYQVDYCKMGEQPSELYDSLLRASRLHGSFPPDCPINLPDSPYRPQQRRPIAFRPAIITKMAVGGCGSASKKGKQTSSMEGRGPVMPFGVPKSTYQDTICKVGEFIMKDKLHQHRGLGAGRKVHDF